MKIFKTSFTSLFITIAISSFTLSSCDKDPCKENGTTCENGGTPTEDGDNCFCLCTLGYEGEKCSNKIFDKFVGVYGGAAETCTASGNSAYIVTIKSDSTDASKGKVENLFGSGFFTNLKVKTPTELEIPEQDFGSGSTNPKINGKITIINSKIVVNYYIKLSGGLIDSCTVSLN